MFHTVLDVYSCSKAVQCKVQYQCEDMVSLKQENLCKQTAEDAKGIW